MAPISNKVVSEEGSIRRSRSLPSSSSPRAVDPNTRALLARCDSTIARIAWRCRLRASEGFTKSSFRRSTLEYSCYQPESHAMSNTLFDTAPDFSQPIAVLKHCHDRIRKQLQTLQNLLSHLPQHGADIDAQKAAQAVL